MATVSDEAATEINELLAGDQGFERRLRMAVMGGECSGFQVTNPNARATCGCGESF